MPTSPVTCAEGHTEAELYTPSNIDFGKDRRQEITPDDDHKIHGTTPSLPRPNKALAADKNLKEKGHKLSKRKLFPGQSINSISGNESACGSVEKRKKLYDSSTSDTKNPASCPAVKFPLTERQQLAFLLEVTSAQTSTSDCLDDESGQESFTKVRSRGKGKKRKFDVVSPRVYRRNERGETPLHIAAMKGDVDGIKKLMKDGAEVDAKDYAGWTPLHEACNYGNLAATKILLGHRAPVNMPGFEGDTPLHDAVINNHVEVVDALLTSGANPRQANTKGKSPVDLITTKEMSEIFASHGVQLHATRSDELAACRPLIQNTISVSNTDKTMIRQTKTHNKCPLLGNEIQRKQTQGESKMEKPVMYICKLTAGGWDEEIMVTTTQACCREPEKAEMHEEPGVKLNGKTESETVLSFLPQVEGSSTSENEEKTVFRKENAIHQREVSAGEVTDDIFEDGNPKNKGDVLPDIEKSPHDGIQKGTPSQEDNVAEADGAGEVIHEEQHLGVIGQPETESAFQGGLSRCQEDASSNSTSKETRENDRETEADNGTAKDESEIFVRSSGTTHGDSKESIRNFTPLQQSIITGSATSASLEPVSLYEDISVVDEMQGTTSQASCRVSGVESEDCSGKTECPTLPGVQRKDLIAMEIVDRGEGKETSSKEFVGQFETRNTSPEARSLDKLIPTTSPNQDVTPQINKPQGRPPPDHSLLVELRRSVNNPAEERERFLSCHSKATKPSITWRSLLPENKCNLTELKIPCYDQFFINTKEYELSNDATRPGLEQATMASQPLVLTNEKEKLYLIQKRATEELTRKHKSDEAKLQMCMEQEIVRCYAKNAYSALKRSPPPGVCAALFWQSLTPQRLKIEKKNAQKRHVLESSSIVSESSLPAEIIDKYEKLKELMALRHKHEQQALDAVNKQNMGNV